MVGALSIVEFQPGLIGQQIRVAPIAHVRVAAAREFIRASGLLMVLQKFFGCGLLEKGLVEHRLANGALITPARNTAKMDKGQRAKGKGQRAKDKGQRAKDKGQRTKGKGQRTKGKGQRTKDKGQRTKDKGQRTKDKGQRGSQ